jgi:ppGpp synthetase/RelA/SpoT-type nucleotidyltranferase
VVEELDSQNRLVSAISNRYPEARVRDLRPEPRHGYRAVHVVLRCGEQPYELQIRTFLENLWAQTSERLADETTVELKYGGGDAELDARAVKIQRSPFQELAKESRLPELWQRLMDARDEARVKR